MGVHHLKCMTFSHIVQVVLCPEDFRLLYNMVQKLEISSNLHFLNVSRGRWGERVWGQGGERWPKLCIHI
jgi:hypothetical protein